MKQENKYRHWCKTCNDFTIHTYSGENLKCENCSTVYTDIYISEIPEDKLEAQRNRYKAQRKKRVQGKLMMYMTLGNFNPSDYEDSIIESDAGLENIEEIEREERKRIIQEMKDEVNKADALNRNDPCYCGSGKKFKHCCWNKIQNYKYKLK